MNVTFDCPNCHATTRAEVSASSNDLACHACSHAAPRRASSLNGAVLSRCVLCGTEDMYVQKDFSHRLGLSIVLAGTLLSSLAWWRFYYPLALGILLATAGLDALLYYLVGDATVCYRCLAQHRGFERDPRHKPFDLAIGERYRQERLRLAELRRSATPSVERTKTLS